MKLVNNTKVVKMIAVIAFLLTIGPISWIVYGNEEKDITYSIHKELKEEATISTLTLEVIPSSKVKEISKIILPDGRILKNQKTFIYVLQKNGEYKLVIEYKVLEEDEDKNVVEVIKQENIWYQEKNIKNSDANITNTIDEEGDTENILNDNSSVYASGDVFINDTNFPDINFRKWLLNKDNINSYGQDGKFTVEELANIIEIDVMSQNIESLKGIEYFTSLISLQCHDNKLTEIDLSKNLKLRHFQCSNNFITSIEIAQNKELLTFDCHNNQITNLDISQNSALMSLYCDNNKLTKLDTSHNTALKILKCTFNQLTTLYLENNPNLEDVKTNEQYIDVPLTYSDSLWKSNPTIAYTVGSIDNSTIHYDINTGQFSTSNTSGASSRFTTDCTDGRGTIRKVEGYLNFIYVGIEVNDTNFPDDNFRNWLLNSSNIHSYGNDALLTLEELSNITEINVDSQNITSLKGLEFFTSLLSLQCQGNYLKELDIGNNITLTELFCQNNQLTKLDVSKNVLLTTLYCDTNQLTSLDVEQLSSLMYLSCHTNPIKNLNVSNNVALRMLHCYNNELTELNVENNVSLVTLYCYNNALTKLDVSNNVALTYFQCYKNSLETLDISKNRSLSTLYCFDNLLTDLDSSQNDTLAYLQCQNNQITNLDVSNNIALLLLYCHGNRLSTLELEKNKKLQTLYCYSNQLTELDVSNNISLVTLYCQNNQLLSLDLSKNMHLANVTASSQNREITLSLQDDKWKSNSNKTYKVGKVENANISFDALTGQFMTSNAITKSSIFTTDCDDGNNTTHTVKGTLRFIYDGFIPVTNIENVPKLIKVNEVLTLGGTVEPANATEKNILWSLKNAGTTGASLVDGKLTVQRHGTVEIIAVVPGGTIEGDYKQDFSIVTFVEPATLIAIPAFIEMEKVSGSALFEAEKEEEISIVPTTNTDIYTDNFYVQTDPSFYLMHTKDSDEWFTVQVYDQNSHRITSRTTPLAILNSTTQRQKFYIKAFKDIARERGIYEGTMEFIIGYGAMQ